jgi:MFS transporter, SHS family, lactate transporter
MWAVLGYPYFFVSDFGLYVAVFFMQFMIQDIFGVVPIYLIELSPPAFRTFCRRHSLQPRYINSIPNTVIDTKNGQHYPLPSKVQDGVIARISGYIIGMAIFMAFAFVYLILMVFLDTENRKDGISDDEQVADEDGAGFDATSPVVAHGRWGEYSVIENKKARHCFCASPFTG